MRRARGGLRALLRFVASVLITSGLLLIADAGVTLAWQEPISALLSSREQARLERQLEAAAGRLGPGDLRDLAAVWERRTGRGEAFGRIELPTLGRRYSVVEGTRTRDLRRGPGHYPDTPLPGQRGTVAVAGHRTTYGAPFRRVDRLRAGEPVLLEMPYGRFTYRVERTRIVRPTDTWVKRRVAHDRLILSACHPLYSAEKRIVVFARLERAEPL